MTRTDRCPCGYRRLPRRSTGLHDLMLIRPVLRTIITIASALAQAAAENA